MSDSVYLVDEEEVRKVQADLGKRILGVECPVRNEKGNVCRECERVQKLWNTNIAENQELARQRSAKPSYFLNVILEDGSQRILKIGKDVARQFHRRNEKYAARTGKVFGYANPDAGEWVEIEKEGTHPNFSYRFEPTGEEADPVGKEDIDDLYDLSDITSAYRKGEIDIFDISSIQTGSSLKFRPLPSPTGKGKYRLFTVVYYHWRCSEADILRGDNVLEEEEADSAFEEYLERTKTKEETPPPAEKEEPKKFTLEDPPLCFNQKLFDGADDCMEPECDLIRDECARRSGYVKTDDGYKKAAKKKKK